jgi:hypothetical protein
MYICVYTYYRETEAEKYILTIGEYKWIVSTVYFKFFYTFENFP